MKKIWLVSIALTVVAGSAFAQGYNSYGDGAAGGGQGFWLTLTAAMGVKLLTMAGAGQRY